MMSYKEAYQTLIVTINWSGVITKISYPSPQLIKAM